MGVRLRVVAAAVLLLLMFLLAGGSALRESVTVDEVAHVGAGLSYWQRLDLRFNPEHPPLAKLIAAAPLAIRGTHADYTSPSWKLADTFFPAYATQWIFGDAVLGRWNDWKSTLLLARLPMLLLTLWMGWILYRYGTHLGGAGGGLVCLAAFVTTPAFLVFGPLVLTDLPVTLFSLIAVWQLGEIWTDPSRRNTRLFGVACATAFLSKFTGLLLIPVALLFFLQTRFWPTASEPSDKAERKLWRKVRWRSVLAGLMWAALLVYAVYFILSWNQPDDALNRVGSGTWAWLVRRPLMPLWLYCRGLLLMLLMSSRSTFLLGHTYPHGVFYYFPVVFVLKSTLGFLVLSLLAASAAIVGRRRTIHVIPQQFNGHWRALLVAFFVFLGVCLLSQLDISIRHFLVPVALLTLLLAPVPNLIAALPGRRIMQGIVVIALAASFTAVFRAYPHFFPFVNSLSFGHPVYYLMNDSNVSWNEALPTVARFAQDEHLSELKLDWASLSDPALVVPQAQPWDCQTPDQTDAGHWIVVPAVSILENRNCSYLEQFPKRAIAGGSMYAFRLPTPIPPAGAAGGPPLPSERKTMWGMPIDLRSWALSAERHPEQLPAAIDALMKSFEEQQRKQQAAQKTRK